MRLQLLIKLTLLDFGGGFGVHADLVMPEVVEVDRGEARRPSVLRTWSVAAPALHLGLTKVRGPFVNAMRLKFSKQILDLLQVSLLFPNLHLAHRRDMLD